MVADSVWWQIVFGKNGWNDIFADKLCIEW